jgi:hypothetical protein
MNNRIRKWLKQGDFSLASDDGYHEVRYVDINNNIFVISKWDEHDYFALRYAYPQCNYRAKDFSRLEDLDYYWLRTKEGEINGNAIHSVSIETADVSQLKFFIDEINHINPLWEILDEIYFCAGIELKSLPDRPRAEIENLMQTVRDQAEAIKLLTKEITAKSERINALEAQVSKLEEFKLKTDLASDHSRVSSQINELIRQRQQSELLQNSQAAEVSSMQEISSKASF